MLGRYLARMMRFEHVTTLRFAFGLPASAIALLVLGAPAFASGHDTFWIAVLALVTGLVALGLYYYGLQRTPAVAATLAELAFPVSAILVGYFKFGQTLTGWQWVGVAADEPRRRAAAGAAASRRSRRAVARARTGVITICDVGPRDGLQNEPGRARAGGARRARVAARRRADCRGSRRSRSCATTACRRWPARRRSSPRPSAAAPSCRASC